MIALTLLTQTDCPSCVSAKRVLDELASEFPLEVDEVDVHSGNGQTLALEHRLAFTPGLIANGQLIAHGRLSKRALRRHFTKITGATRLRSS